MKKRMTTGAVLPGYAAILLLHAFLAAMPAQACDPLPIEKDGLCPFKYSPSGIYCIPQPGAQPAILKRGLCPFSYSPSGNYCLGGNNASAVIEKHGPCPSGFTPSGEYCLGQEH